MLKIKDEVDLKELEKFGFKECRDYFYYTMLELQVDICINKKSRTISKFSCDININGKRRDRRTKILREIPIVEDLIQANIVEE